MTPFYPRRGRKRCTLQNVMALYNVHYLCYKTYVIVGEPIATYWAQFQTLRKTEKKPSISLPNPGIEPLSDGRTCDHLTNEAVIVIKLVSASVISWFRLVTGRWFLSSLLCQFNTVFSSDVLITIGEVREIFQANITRVWLGTTVLHHVVLQIGTITKLLFTHTTGIWKLVTVNYNVGLYSTLHSETFPTNITNK